MNNQYFRAINLISDMLHMMDQRPDGPASKWYRDAQALVQEQPAPNGAVKRGDYWQKAMSRRMPFCFEADRLETVIHGFFARQTEETDILEFWDSKRPYGNKCIEASIAYNLGWDYERRLCHEYMPEWVEAEAMKLHAAVFEELMKERALAAAGKEPT